MLLMCGHLKVLLPRHPIRRMPLSRLQHPVLVNTHPHRWQQRLLFRGVNLLVNHIEVKDRGFMHLHVVLGSQRLLGFSGRKGLEIRGADDSNLGEVLRQGVCPKTRPCVDLSGRLQRGLSADLYLLFPSSDLLLLAELGLSHPLDEGFLLIVEGLRGVAERDGHTL